MSKTLNRVKVGIKAVFGVIGGYLGVISTILGTMLGILASILVICLIAGICIYIKVHMTLNTLIASTCKLRNSKRHVEEFISTYVFLKF